MNYLTGNLYGRDVINLVTARGYDDEAHRKAIIKDVAENNARLDSDAVTLTHPSNWLTEKEVEDLLYV